MQHRLEQLVSPGETDHKIIQHCSYQPCSATYTSYYNKGRQKYAVISTDTWMFKKTPLTENLRMLKKLPARFYVISIIDVSEDHWYNICLKSEERYGNKRTDEGLLCAEMMMSITRKALRKLANNVLNFFCSTLHSASDYRDHLRTMKIAKTLLTIVLGRETYVISGKTIDFIHHQLKLAKPEQPLIRCSVLGTKIRVEV